MLGFFRWLTGKDRSGEAAAQKRQNQQLLDSSIRRLARADQASAVNEQLLQLAAHDLRTTVDRTVKELNAADCALRGATQAVEISRRH